MFNIIHTLGLLSPMSFFSSYCVTTPYLLLHIKWQDRKTNTEVLEQANIPSIESMLLSRQLMDELYGELLEGKRNRGAPETIQGPVETAGKSTKHPIKTMGEHC